ncbi:hypothetical protein [Staphylococcus phage vB_SauM-V1SA12]|nr:hypothetical protein 357Saur119PP_00006 [Staphylococcus phage 357Saur119PP]WPF67373.1 hypothetical protein [Staphylococcus phage vB_SauM-V1SA12]
MIIVYFDGKNKSILSTVLKFIKNTSIRDLTYDTANKKADVNIITREHIDKHDVQELSSVTYSNTVCISASDTINQYRSGKSISISELEEYIKGM